MRIWTSSWFAALHPSIVRVGISRSTPRGHPAGFRIYRRLSPGAWYTRVSYEQYERRYRAEVLGRLDPRQVAKDLERIGEGHDVALLSFERAADQHWCHRALVSVWLYETLDLEIYEYGMEYQGFGRSHPKLPPHIRLVHAR